MEDIQSGSARRHFQTVITEDVMEFLKKQDIKARRKILYNVRKAEIVSDPELFKKLTDDIWEFRTLWKKTHYRLLAFWDNEDGKVVIAAHCFVKKTSKVPSKEISKAMEIRRDYFRTKNPRKYEIV